MRTLTKIAQVWLVLATLFLFMGLGDDSARFKSLGHQLMCMCSCNQVLLECNHVGCTYSDRMRGELVTAMDRGDNDSLVLQDFVQKYGPTVLLAPATTGFGRVAWVTPFAALFIGVVGVVVIVRVWNKRPSGGPPSANGTAIYPDGLDSYRDQVRKDTEL